MNGYAYYKGLIQTKLAALVDDDDFDKGETDSDPTIFYEVKIGADAKFTGYPSAQIINKSGQGQVQNTQQNQREWLFSVLLIHQFADGIDNDTAEGYMDNVLDKTIAAFDEDYDLGNTCKFVKVVPVQYSYKIIQEPFIFAELTISVVELVNRYPSNS